LQRVEPVISIKTKTDNSAKNTSEDVDRESFALHKFLKLVSEGQTVAMDMIFTTTDPIITADPLWSEIVSNRHRLLCRQVKAAIGYSRTQANKYGIKGSRVAAARKAVELFGDFLQNFPSSTKVKEFADVIESEFANIEHVEFIDRENPGGVLIRYLSVCNRQAPYTQSIKETYLVLKRLFDEYGQRALMAESNQNIDWKALSHAVRVGRQSIELLETGYITFPRPERQHLLDIKLGNLPYKQAAEEIEELLPAVEQSALTSSLPDKPDLAWIDDFVFQVYSDSVKRD